MQLRLGDRTKQRTVELVQVLVGRLDRRTREENGHVHARPGQLSVVVQAPALQRRDYDRRGARGVAGECGRRAGLVVVLDEAQQTFLVGALGAQVCKHLPGVARPQPVV